MTLINANSGAKMKLILGNSRMFTWINKRMTSTDTALLFNTHLTNHEAARLNAVLFFSGSIEPTLSKNTIGFGISQTRCAGSSGRVRDYR
ncbi:hypothetical protein ON064_05245 [Planococcus sp. A6]|uniref:hypothetical protein n=1 Tax=Planococcus sp. A6 TaxID=2992760 RepID=UPI00237B8993|nr:hypothetical protein [Planococcus sp. A6]MDE0582447.1 hypothetical protein [Planococcus sp. A6]